MIYEITDIIKIDIKSMCNGESIFPNTAEKNPMMHMRYNISLYNMDATKQTHFNFYESTHEYQSGKTTMSDRDMLFALRSIIEDAQYTGESFTDFCDSLGYSDDSIRAHKIYRECLRSAQKLDRMGISEDIRNEIIRDLNEKEIN